MSVMRCAMAIPTNWRASSEHCWQAHDGHHAGDMWSYLTCAPPAALASCAAARRVQDCDSHPPVFVRQRPGLPGRRLSARRRRPCQTTAFCRHSSTCCQSDEQQFWRQDLYRHRTASLEQSAAQSQTMCAVIRPVQAITEDIFIWTVRQRRSVNCFNSAE